jgi:hypothetical protein
MSTSLSLKTQIKRSLDQLDPEQLAKLWEYIEQLRAESLPPLYTLHEQAIETGIKDLADHHDRYLYGGAS